MNERSSRFSPARSGLLALALLSHQSHSTSSVFQLLANARTTAVGSSSQRQCCRLRAAAWCTRSVLATRPEGLAPHKTTETGATQGHRDWRHTRLSRENSETMGDCVHADNWLMLPLRSWLWGVHGEITAVCLTFYVGFKRVTFFLGLCELGGLIRGFHDLHLL